MRRVSTILHSTGFLLSLTLVFYLAGAFFIRTPDIEPLIQSGIATQDEYTYYDNEGEEHDGHSLVEVAGIGRILTYKDIYYAPVPIFLIALFIRAFLFSKGDILGSSEDLRYAVFANCVIGALLIWLTSKGTILSTILYWLGVLSSYFAVKKDSARSKEDTV